MLLKAMVELRSDDLLWCDRLAKVDKRQRSRTDNHT
jgi:hypothetical protein